MSPRSILPITLKPESPPDSASSHPNSGRSVPRRNASRACVQCQVKRRKCDASDTVPICSFCAKEGTDCVVDRRTDQRSTCHRNVAKADQSLLNSLLGALRETPPSETAALLDLIRQNASKSQIKSHIERARKKSDQSDAGTLTPFSISEISEGMTGIIQLDPSIRGSPRSSNESQDRDDMEDSISPEAQSVIEPSGSCRSTATSINTEIVENCQVSTQTAPDVRSRISDGQKHIYIQPGAVRSFGNLSMSSAILANGYPEDIQIQQLRPFRSSIQTCLPVTIVGEGQAAYITRAALSFKDVCRSMILAGASTESILSTDGLDLELFFRDRRPDDPHNVSTWACEFAKTWTFLPLYFRLASVHWVGTFMRWLILPCRETYDMLSPLMRPIPSQLLIPHSVDVDFCHVPCIRNSQLDRGPTWVDLITADSHRLDWALPDDACIETVVDKSGRPVQRLSKDFLVKVDHLESWSLSSKVLANYPDIAGSMSFYND